MRRINEKRIIHGVNNPEVANGGSRGIRTPDFLGVNETL